MHETLKSEWCIVEAKWQLEGKCSPWCGKCSLDNINLNNLYRNTFRITIIDCVHLVTTHLFQNVVTKRKWMMMPLGCCIELLVVNGCPPLPICSWYDYHQGHPFNVMN